MRELTGLSGVVGLTALTGQTELNGVTGLSGVSAVTELIGMTAQSVVTVLTGLTGKAQTGSNVATGSGGVTCFASLSLKPGPQNHSGSHRHGGVLETEPFKQQIRDRKQINNPLQISIKDLSKSTPLTFEALDVDGLVTLDTVNILTRGTSPHHSDITVHQPIYHLALS